MDGPQDEVQPEAEDPSVTESSVPTTPPPDTPPPAAEAQEGSTSSSPTPSPQSKSKIDVLLRPAGNAPILKKKKWAVERVKTIGSVNIFLKKYMRCDPSDSIFLYVNQAFAPSPDVEVGTVFDCFGSDGKLVLHYSLTQAWG